MASLVCEICGGKLTGKAGGIFVCESCGMEYDKSWAQEKVQEIKGTVQIEGKVDVSGSEVKVDNKKTLENYLNLSESYLKNGNKKDALLYADKALGIDSTNSRAWMFKMESIEFLNKDHYSVEIIYKDKVIDSVSSGRNAIINASNEEKSVVSKNVLTIAFTNAIDYFKKQNGCIKRGDYKFQKYYYNDEGLYYWEKYHECSEKMMAIIVDIVKAAAPESFAENRNLETLAFQCTDQYKNELAEIDKRMDHYFKQLKDHNKIKELRIEQSSVIHQTISNDISKYHDTVEMEKKKRIEEYWNENPEAKAQLEQEKKELNNRVEELKKVFISENTKIQNMIRNVVEPDSLKADRKERSDLQKELLSLGMFKNKEKKELQERIDELTRKIKSAEKKLDAEECELKKKAADLRNEYEQQTKPLVSRMKEIDAKLHYNM